MTIVIFHFTAGESFQCPYDGCDKKFTLQSSVQKHIDTWHRTGLIGYGEFSCEICDSTFKSPNFFLAHSQEAHQCVPKLLQEWATFKCDHCPRVFLNRSICYQHTYLKHGKKKWTRKQRMGKPCNGRVGKTPLKKFEKSCEYCGKVFKTQTNYVEHIKVVHENNATHQCDQCSQKYGLKSKLKDHIRQVHTRVHCDVCGMQLYNYFYLKKHKASVHGIIPPGSFKCGHCPMWFKLKPNLVYHLRSKHNI